MEMAPCYLQDLGKKTFWLVAITGTERNNKAIHFGDPGENKGFPHMDFLLFPVLAMGQKAKVNLAK